MPLISGFGIGVNGQDPGIAISSINYFVSLVAFVVFVLIIIVNLLISFICSSLRIQYTLLSALAV